MALYDPDAAGNAAPYLRLDSVTLMEIKSAPFDGKTAVWVPYSETGYTKAGFKLFSHDLLKLEFCHVTSIFRLSGWITTEMVAKISKI